LPNEVSSSVADHELRVWLKRYVPLSIFSGLFILNKHVNTLILSLIGTNEEVGFYRIAFMGTELLSSAEKLIYAVFAPYIVQLYQDDHKRKLQKMMVNGTRVALVMILPLSIAYLFWGEVVVSALFGDEYLPSVGALGILTIGKLIGLMTGAAALVLVMTGHEKEIVKTMVYALLLNVILSIILIPIYGDIGAAIAASMSIVFLKLVLAYRVIVVTNIRTGIV
jgi:O-antigen/teichoic acid export membrane protein